MARKQSSKRGWILAGVFGAFVATGMFMVIPGASAVSGNGGQGSLVLGSNSVGSPDASPDSPNVASAATDLQASPNFGNYVAYGPYLFRVDATQSVSGNIDGIRAAGRGTGTGVQATSQSGVGVVGESDSASGTGVSARSTSGLGLSVQGRATFSRSGEIVVAKGHAFVTKSMKLGSSALVLATIQGNVAGVYVQGVTVAAGSNGSFAIHLNKVAPSNVSVAWFVLN